MFSKWFDNRAGRKAKYQTEKYGYRQSWEGLAADGKQQQCKTKSLQRIQWLQLEEAGGEFDMIRHTINMATKHASVVFQSP